MSRRDLANSLVQAALELSSSVGRLKFRRPVTHVYNPLDYAWRPHELYLRRFGDGAKRIVFVGMNPGPFGMAQTGVPFGEVSFVRDWMEIEAPVRKPLCEHPKRPVEGFDCRRSEVSGRRLWGLFRERFGGAEKFFAEHFVSNYCPLAFFDAGGRNLTPDKLPVRDAAPLFEVCDLHLRRVLEILGPCRVIGVGGFAAQRTRVAAEGLEVQIGQILHPSPASPAANRDWAGAATAQLVRMGVWSD